MRSRYFRADCGLGESHETPHLLARRWGGWRRPAEETVNAAGEVQLKGGISAYGSKALQSIRVAGTDVIERVTALAGAAVDATSAEGVVAVTCP